MTYKISFLLQHLIKSRIEKGWGGGLILSVGGVREFFFFSFQRVTAGHGCCLGEVIYSPVGAVSWSLQHPQTGFPNEDDAVALSFRLESGLSILMHSHIGIKAPALGKPLHLLFGIPPRSPVNERRSVHSEPLPAHADLRAGAHVATRSGHTEQVMESSQVPALQEWGMGGSSSFPEGRSCLPLFLTERLWCSPNSLKRS